MPRSDPIKPDPYRAPTPDTIERGRAMYRDGFTVARCLAATGMSLGTFYYWLDGGPRDESGTPQLAPVARRRVVVGKRRKPFAASHTSLLARLYRTAERQAFEIEQRLAVPAAATPQRERDVRMLNLLGRTLRDLSALGPPGGAHPDDGEQARLAEARRRLDKAEKLREAEQHTSLVRHLLRYLKDVRQIETLQTKRAAKAQETQAREAADIEEFQRVFAQRLRALAAARERNESGETDD